MRRLAAALALAAMFGAVPGGEHALAKGRAYAPPKQLVLSQKDVPPGFRATGAGALSNSQADRADKLPAGTFARHGRITSYETSFRHPRDRAASIVDSIIAFHSAAGAHWEFKRSVGKGSETLYGQTFRKMHVQGFGNEAAGFLYQQLLGSTLITCGVAIFRRGSYVAWVATCDHTQSYSLRASPTLAFILDRNIRSATGAN
jgi:hypothetical protein